MMITNRRESKQEKVKTPRGVLSFVLHPNEQQRNVASAIHTRYSTIPNTRTHHLQYFAMNPTAPRLTNIRRNRKRRVRNRQQKSHEEFHDNDMEDVENQHDCGAGINDAMTAYHPANGEFTLVFFCDLHCRNSQRFTLVLSKFMKTILKNHDDITPCQLICITNDDLPDSCSSFNNGSSLNGSSLDESIITHLSSETEFWHLGHDHINRLAIIRMLAVSHVPSLIVIDNETGKVLTLWGMEAIETSRTSKDLLDQWRRGNAGISACSRMMKFFGC